MTILHIAIKAAPLALGAILGYAYYYFIGCASGACPITAKWWTSVAYGTLVGATFLLPPTKKKTPARESETTGTHNEKDDHASL